MIVDARVDALECENERLRDRVGQLEDAMGMSFLTPIEWRLTGSEQRVFGVLMARELATKQAVMAALYHSDGLKDEAEPKIVDVFVCKARKKLKGFGVKIETRWGEGYYLTPQTKAVVRARMAESAPFQPDAAPSGREAVVPRVSTHPGTNLKTGEAA